MSYLNSNINQNQNNNINKQQSENENYLEEEDDFKNDINDSANYLTFAKNEEIKKEPIYIMTIELEKERSDIIQIFNDSNPEDLAFEFCKKNNLNLKAMGFLSGEIEKLLNKFTLHRKINIKYFYQFLFTI